MARSNFIVDQGFEIADLSSMLSGSGAPGGDAGPQDDAAIGSLYLQTTGVLWKKEADGDEAADWKRIVDESVYTALGLAFDAEDFGAFSGSTLSDDSDAKSLLQELETAHEEVDQNVDDLIELSGVPENSTDLGNFTGVTIPDNSDNKEAMQALETAVEAIQGGVGSTDVISAATPTTISECLVDSCNGVEWEITVWETASEATKEFFKVTSLHNGTSSADADDFKYSTHTKLKLADIAGLSFVPVFSGSGASQSIGLQISATAGITVISRRTDIP